MKWLLQNPEKSLRQCADHFGFTQSWLSTVIHSDAFQAQYKALQAEANSRVVADIPARMTRILDVALDKLGDMVEQSEDKDFILETSDKILNRMGFAPNSKSAPAAPPSTINNTFIVNQADLAAARQNFGRVIEHEDSNALPNNNPVPAAEPLRSGD